MKVLLVDDHTLFSQSLALALHQFQENLVADIVNSEALLEKFLTRLDQYDAVLLDIHLEKSFTKDGFEVAVDLKNARPDLPIVMLTGFDLPVYEYKTRQLGLQGFVNKNSQAKQLINIINLVISGHSYFSKQKLFVMN